MNFIKCFLNFHQMWILVFNETVIHTNTEINSTELLKWSFKTFFACIFKKICLKFISEENRDFPGGSKGKGYSCNAGNLGSIPGSGRFPGKGNGKPPQYSCLENSTDRGAWWAIVHGIAKSQTCMSNFHFHSEINIVGLVFKIRLTLAF